MITTASSAAESPEVRVVPVNAVVTELEGVQGRTLFPTLQQGPWWPIARFAESAVDPAAAERDPHPHEHEEVVNYLLAGELSYASEDGEPIHLSEGAVTLLTAARPRTHDLYPTGARRTRWISVVVRLPSETAEPRVALRRGEASRAERLGADVERRDLVGPRTQLAALSGLEVFDLRVGSHGSAKVELGAGRRAVAYVPDGVGTIQGLTAMAGTGVLVEGVDRLDVRSAAGLSVVVATIPAP